MLDFDGRRDWSFGQKCMLSRQAIDAARVSRPGAGRAVKADFLLKPGYTMNGNGYRHAVFGNTLTID